MVSQPEAVTDVILARDVTDIELGRRARRRLRRRMSLFHRHPTSPSRWPSKPHSRIRRCNRLAQLDPLGRKTSAKGRAGRLLDLHVHQLAAHARVVRAWAEKYTGRWSGRGGSAHALVPLRARRRQTSAVRFEEMNIHYPVALEPDYASGRRSQITTGRLCTSRTPRGGSAITTRPKARTTSPSVSSRSFLGRGRGELVSVSPEGFEVQADWENLESPRAISLRAGTQFRARHSPGGAAPQPVDALRDWAVERRRVCSARPRERSPSVSTRAT
jgi:hypothetical protein